MSNPKEKLPGWKSLMDQHLRGWSEPDSWLINLNAIDWMHVEKNEFIVDIGVGGGGSIPFLLERTSNIAAVDFSINGLKEISNSVGGVCVVQADGSRLPFKSNVFDKAISTYVFHNLPTETERQRFINEASRITKKGGLCVFARIPNKIAGYLQPLNYLSKKKLKAYILRLSLYYHTYTVNEIRLMLKEANLEMVSWRPTALPPPKLGIIRKKFGLSYSCLNHGMLHGLTLRQSRDDRSLYHRPQKLDEFCKVVWLVSLIEVYRDFCLDWKMQA